MHIDMPTHSIFSAPLIYFSHKCSKKSMGSVCKDSVMVQFKIQYIKYFTNSFT
jgi:hypothetical protein